MLKIRRNLLKLQQMTVATTATNCRDKNYYKDEKKRFQQVRLSRIQSADPFKTNVGLRHQLRTSGLPDPEDPVFQGAEENIDISEQFESIISESKVYQRQVEQGLTRKMVTDKQEVRRAIVKKKYDPDPPPAILTTWLESEMIKKLHAQDPTTWTYERLSECFPVTPESAKKIAKDKHLWKPHEIINRNAKAKENWKLLLKGKLPNSEKILQHFQDIGYDFSTLGKHVTSQQRQELEQAILSDYQLRLNPPKPKLTGKFGSILANHRARTGQHMDPQEPIVIKDLLDDESNFASSLNMPSPYGDTSLINAESNQKYDKKNLDIGQFRKLFMAEMKKKAKKDENAKKYFKWLKTENVNFEASQPSEPKFLEGFEIEEDLSQNEGEVQKYKENILLPNETKKSVDFIEEKITIPASLQQEDAVYRKGDDFYDCQGEFLYRVPTQSAVKND